MAKVTFKVDTSPLLDVLKMFQNISKQPLTKRDLNKIGSNQVELMKGSISKGKSPVRGVGRFPPYKDRKKYPGPAKGPVRKRFPKKRARPVNLFLSGKMLKNLKHKVTSKRKITVGYRGRSAQQKAIGNANEVTKKPFSPSRKTIPQGSQVLESRITRKLERLYLNILTKRLDRLLK